MFNEPSVTYVDRAIQTEPPRHLSRSDGHNALNLHEPLSFQDVDAAYSQLSSLTISKRDHKLSQLAYKKPSELNALKKRIVSLPETSPPSRIDSEPIRDRVVSMSEQVKVSLVSSADNSLSSDCFESSVETSQSQILSELGSSSAKRTRPRQSLAFPQTPSPPSSPESIMIIGNNMQVPSSFLRQKAIKFPKALDDNTWNTWASSPPRPIPALHGPLSLPYARCPSGAEGTIIEGEDMTRTIWGLGNDAGAREHGVDTKFDTHPDQSLSVQKRDNLNQSKLPTLGICTVSNTPSERVEQFTVLGNPPSDSLYVSSSSVPGIDALNHLPDNLKRSAKGRDSVQGLGLVWNNTQPTNADIHRINGQPHLKASAPEFIPRGRLSDDPQPRVTVEPAVRSHYIVPKPQIPAIDLAYEYRAQRERKTPLLASPSSTSSTWSPYLSTPLPLHTERFADVWNSEDAADELRRYIFERIGQQNLSPGELKQISELARSMNLDRTSAYPSSSYERPSFATKFPPGSPLKLDFYHPGPPPNTPLPSIPSQNPKAVLLAPPSPESSVFRLGGRPGTQPRSVPFARLLQRKLSVVPEEPGSTAEHPPTSPQNERPAFRGGAEGQHYKPYFARTSQNTPRLPDIFNHDDGKHRSHSYSSNFGSEPFTAGNLEVGGYIQLGPRTNLTNASTHARAVKLPFQGAMVPEDIRERPCNIRSNMVATASSGAIANKENGPAIGRCDSAGSNRGGKTFSNGTGKETIRKKFKSKKQGNSVTSAETFVPSTGDPWLSGPELDAWLG
ncbi:hypothetical protein F5876DRAFT_62040 [Lentinula aff. lateritia]|uniref:Uncharacterized protein n=1 Tax=Lentinula aff. lateritia TaxID=2804960 RepID=A0ACC1UCC8_9AGAR|nr:hypothetical protein F5876DRAFT_62040 [Lentinula aff. lateritia]